jgi:hypothetical protein
VLDLMQALGITPIVDLVPLRHAAVG